MPTLGAANDRPLSAGPTLNWLHLLPSGRVHDMYYMYARSFGAAYARTLLVLRAGGQSSCVCVLPLPPGWAGEVVDLAGSPASKVAGGIGWDRNKMPALSIAHFAIYCALQRTSSASSADLVPSS